jgi:hypothetical protein
MFSCFKSHEYLLNNGPIIGRSIEFVPWGETVVVAVADGIDGNFEGAMNGSFEVGEIVLGALVGIEVGLTERILEGGEDVRKLGTLDGDKVVGIKVGILIDG